MRCRSLPCRCGAGVLLTVLAVLLCAASAGAQTPAAQAADEALQEVQDLTNGEGVRTGRELTLALVELRARRSDLSSGERRQADRILARPTDPGDSDPYLDATPRRDCTAHFCIHWSDMPGDPNAPSLFDGPDAGTLPDYVDEMKAAFERAYQVENVELGWRLPLPDGTRGGDGRIDVYIAQIGDDDLYGYAAPEGSGRTTTAYQVMDNDYAPSEFPGYDDPSVPMEVTAAHEYNHILQFAYDAQQDGWMAESTATWAEDKVFDDDNDWYQYMTRWGDLPGQPITAAPSGSNGLKIYGSAIWDHWIDRRCGPSVVRRAWETSVAHSVAGGGFAPVAYDAALREYGGNAVTFAREFGEFAAATAEWELAGSRIHEGAGFFPTAGAVTRAEDTLSPSGGSVNLVVDHTAYALVDVPVSPAAGLRLTGTLPAGTPGTIALVGRDGTDVVKVSTFVPGGGAYNLVLADTGRFDRITAVLVNGSTAQSGYNGVTGDWKWTRDDQSVQANATTLVFNSPEIDAAKAAESAPEPACSAPEKPPIVVTPTPTPTPSVTPSPTVTPTPTPTPPPTVRTSVKLSRGTSRIASVARRGRLPVFATVNKPGALRATATVDRRTAKRLKLGRTRVLAKGTKRIPRPGTFKVNLKLSKKARRGLKRQKRTVKVIVTIRFSPGDGRPSVARRITVRLKR